MIIGSQPELSICMQETAFHSDEESVVIEDLENSIRFKKSQNTSKTFVKRFLIFPRDRNPYEGVQNKNEYFDVRLHETLQFRTNFIDEEDCRNRFFNNKVQAGPVDTLSGPRSLVDKLVQLEPIINMIIMVSTILQIQ